MRKVTAGLSIIKGRYLGIRKPLAIGWKITSRCNCRCRYCGTWKRDSEELSSDRIIELIKEAKSLGTSRISFTGGEPLTHRDIGKFIDTASSCGIEVTLTTNGILLPERVDDIKNVSNVVLSYDGPRNIHDAIRGRGSYDGLIAAIEATREKLDSGIKLRCVLTSENIGCIDEILEFSKQQKIKIGFSIVQNTQYSAADISDLEPGVDLIHRQMDKILDAKNNGHGYIFGSNTSLLHLRRWPDDFLVRCAGGVVYCRIDEKGRVFSCGKLESTESELNCRESSLAQAFSTLKQSGCGQCWCDNNIELNNLFNLKADTIINQLRLSR